jgi:hypothetical protein
MAYFRCIGGNGGGGTPLITFTPVNLFNEAGIGSASWVADTGSTSPLPLQSGTFEAVEGQKVIVNSTNRALFYLPTDSSYYAFGIKCKIDSNFTPRNSNNWYDCSCILGQELGGTQRDCAIIIDKNGYFALGTDNSTVNSTTVYALDGNTHTLIMIVESDNIKLYIDGALEKEVTIGMAGSQMIQIGVFWNKSSDVTRVDGEIYAVGRWSENFPQTQYVIPTL